MPTRLEQAVCEDQVSDDPVGGTVCNEPNAVTDAEYQAGLIAQLRNVTRNLGRMLLVGLLAVVSGAAIKGAILMNVPWWDDWRAANLFGVAFYLVWYGGIFTFAWRTGFIRNTRHNQHQTMRQMQEVSDVDPLALRAAVPQIRLFARGWAGTKEDRTAAREILNRIEAAQAAVGSLPIVGSSRLDYGADLPLVSTAGPSMHALPLVGDGAQSAAVSEQSGPQQVPMT